MNNYTLHQTRKTKTPRLYVCIDQSMIWEAYSDIPITLIIRNLDKGWIRYLPAIVNPEAIEEHEFLLKELTNAKVKQAGLSKEEKKHFVKAHPVKIKKESEKK